MTTLKELLAERARIDEEIATRQREERASAVAQVRTLMDEHSLTLADLETVRVGRAPRNSKGPSSVAAKYRNHATGETWSGRGLQPRWLKGAIEGGAKLEDFKI